MMKKLALIISCVLMTVILSAQTAHKHLRSGDQSYEKQNYSKAEEDYRKAVNKDNSPKSNYNLGNAVYQQEKYKEAVKHYQTTAQNATDEKVKSNAFYNMGNAHLNAYQTAEGEEAKDKEQHLTDAIDSYKQALRHNPKDMDSKHNLTMAMQQMRQNQQQQKQQNQNKDKQDKSDDNKQDDKNKQQENEKDGKEKEEKDQGDKKDGEQNKNKPEEQDGEKDGQEISKKEAEKLLEIMNDEERKVQEKLNKSKSKKRKSEKDW